MSEAADGRSPTPHDAAVVHLTDDHAADPYPLYRRLQAEGGVHRATTPDGAPVWIVTRYPDVRAALADPRLSLDKSHTTTGYTGFRLPPALDHNLLNLDPPDHTRLRRLASAAFTPRRVEVLHPVVRHTADQLLDEALGAAADHVIDVMAAYAEPLPITVIGDLLGVPVEARRRMRTWTDTLLSPDAAGPAAREAVVGIQTLITDLISTRRTTPGDDLVSDLIAVRDGTDRLTEHELTSLAFLVLWAGYENTASTIAASVLTLATRPGLAAVVAAQPDPDTPAMDALVEEFLRVNEPGLFALRRFPTEDITVNGTTIPAGATVLLSLAAANRDPDHFPHPDTVVPPPTTSSTDAPTTPLPRHVTFGHGIHYCLGAALARLEVRTAVWTLLHRHPHLTLAVPPDQVRWRPGYRRRTPESLPVDLGSR